MLMYGENWGFGRDFGQCMLSMSSLTLLATEALDIIAHYLDASVLCRLWLTGDRTLQKKVTNGPSQQLSLCWSSPSWLPWPVLFFRFFSHLKSLEWGSEDVVSCCPTLALSFLPATLQRLSIVADDVYCLLRNQNSRLDVMFPLLTHLKLDGARMKAENMKNLPPHLTELYLGAKYARVSGRDLFGDLPRSLLSLDLIMMLRDDQEDGNPLPPNLQRFHVSHVKSNYDWFKKLPHSVTYLCLAPGKEVKTASLPPNLKELTLFYPGQILRSEVPNLPQSLTAMNVWVVSYGPDDPMATLPKSLTQVKGDYQSDSISKDSLLMAPSGLINFRIECVSSDPDILRYYNPNSRAILLSGREMGQNMIFLNPHPLPLQLTRLKLRCFTDELCLLLPPLLQVLFIDGGMITAKGAVQFKHLTHLYKVVISIDAIVDEVVPYLSHVEKLSFIAHHDTTADNVKLSFNFLRGLLLPAPTTIPTTSDGVGTSNAIMTASPPLVKTLTLWLDSLPEAHSFLSKESFRVLGELLNLTRLRIVAHHAKIKPNWLRHLPPQLLHLSVEMLDDFPESHHLTRLPQGLQTLSFDIRSEDQNEQLAKCTWTDETFACLPRTLRSLDMNGIWSRITPNMNAFTPPYLINFTWAWAPFQHFRSPVDKAEALIHNPASQS